MLWLAIPLLLVLGTGIGLYFYSPALLVDTVDRLANRSDATKVANGVKFGAKPGDLLDIWAPAAKPSHAEASGGVLLWRRLGERDAD